MKEGDRSKEKPSEAREGAEHAPEGTGAGVDYEGPRGDMRYVGGGREGGQNYSSEGYGANQSYSAGPGYEQAPGTDSGAVASGNEPEGQQDFAVEPKDLGVQDYDLQGSYGRPAYGEKPSRDRR